MWSFLFWGLLRIELYPLLDKLTFLTAVVLWYHLLCAERFSDYKTERKSIGKWRKFKKLCKAYSRNGLLSTYVGLRGSCSSRSAILEVEADFQFIRWKALSMTCTCLVWFSHCRLQQKRQTLSGLRTNSTSHQKFSWHCTNITPRPVSFKKYTFTARFLRFWIDQR